jgi:hypothetical protein
MAMTTTSDGLTDAANVELRPGPFCRLLLEALEAAEGQTRRRKRDQAPDRLGLAIKRDLLERAVAADPAPADFEGWLLAQILKAPVAGSVRAMCEQIFLEYRMGRLQPELTAWLVRGAPSDDADSMPSGPEASGGERRRRRRREGAGDQEGHDRWHGRDEDVYDCTCHLPQR